MKSKVVFLMLIITTVISFSCRNAREKRAEKFTEKILENAVGQNVDIDVEGESIIIQTEEGKITTSTGEKKWPKEIPTSVPKFNFGEIENVSIQEFASIKIWAMIFEKVGSKDLSEYEKMLKNNGFETHFSEVSNVGGIVNAEKENINIAVIAGKGNASVSVTIESE